MASTQRAASGSNTPPSARRPLPSSTAVGLIVFAAVIMIMLGALQAIQGLVALFNDDFYVVGQKWIFEFDLTTWGWIHLVVGSSCGRGILRVPGRRLGTAVGIAVAAISAVLNFMWLPYYPIWSLIIIALDVMVIWALSAHGRDVGLLEPRHTSEAAPPPQSASINVARAVERTASRSRLDLVVDNISSAETFAIFGIGTLLLSCPWRAGLVPGHRSLVEQAPGDHRLRCTPTGGIGGLRTPAAETPRWTAKIGYLTVMLARDLTHRTSPPVGRHR